MPKHVTVASRLLALFSKRNFLWFIIAVFSVQALWIAFTANYPMAFDEDFHLGIVRLYAHHLSPFWATQPDNADRFGAVARDPSYLYHYLMSFPYRLISLFTESTAVQVVMLRIINVALFASALPVFRRLLEKTGASLGAIHALLLIFILLPIVPLLGAQINYDNLLMPIVALVFLLALSFVEELQAFRRINIRTLILLVSLGMLASLIKYAFLPILLGIAVFVAVYLALYIRAKGWRMFVRTVAFGMTLLTKQSRILLFLLLLVSSILFAERYGVNIIRYHTPVPDCGKVLSVSQCSQYGPWIRDYTLAQTNGVHHGSPTSFMRSWLYGMWFRTFFAVDGPATHFETRGPLLLPALIGAIVPAIMAFAAVLFGRKVLNRYSFRALALTVGTALLYIAILWHDEYKGYLRTGYPVAINGRYLLPILLPLLLFGVLAVDEALKRHQRIKLSMLAVTIVCLVWGGGALTYILRSKDAWYWPYTPLKSANHAVQKVAGPITPGYKNPSLFLH